MSSSAKLFVGNLPESASEDKLRELFEKFGKIDEITLKEKNSKFAFIQYSNQSDAEDAMDRMKDYELDGRKLRIELATGAKKSASDYENRRGGGRDFQNRSGRFQRSGGFRRSGEREQRDFNNDGSKGRSNDCYICHRPGHIAKYCSENRNNDRREDYKGRQRSRSRSFKRRESRTDDRYQNDNRERRGQGKCYTCGKLGHRAQDCFQAKQGGGRFNQGRRSNSGYRRRRSSSGQGRRNFSNQGRKSPSYGSGGNKRSQQSK